MPTERHRVPITYPDASEPGRAVYATPGGLVVVASGTAGYLWTSGGASAVPEWTFQPGGVGRWTVVTKTASEALDTSTVQFVKADATSGAIVLTLPSVAGVLSGTTKTIKKVDVSGNPVTVTAFAGELIDGEATQILSTQWTAMVLVSDSVGWNIT